MSRKLVISGLLLVVAGTVAVGLYLAFSLDALVARAIEREGTRIVGAPVHVGSVDIQLQEGVGRISSLRVSNPKGFGSGEVFDLHEIELELEVASLREPPIRLSRVDVGETEVRLEIDEEGRSNLDEILQRAKQGSGRSRDEGEGAPNRVAIDQLRFAGGEIRLDRAGSDEPQRMDLPGFSRAGIGGSKGATGGEIAKVVTQALARQVAVSAAASEAERAVEKELGETAGDAAGSLIRGLFGES